MKYMIMLTIVSLALNIFLAFKLRKIETTKDETAKTPIRIPDYSDIRENDVVAYYSEMTTGTGERNVSIGPGLATTEPTVEKSAGTGQIYDNTHIGKDTSFPKTTGHYKSRLVFHDTYNNVVSQSNNVSYGDEPLTRTGESYIIQGRSGEMYDTLNKQP